MSAADIKKIVEEGVRDRKKVIEACKEDPNEPFDCLGRWCRYVPFYTDRKFDITNVEIAGVLFAHERVYHPWNPFKDVVYSHWVHINVSTPERAAEIAKGAGVEAEVEQDPYADPPRWFLITGGDLEDVVKIYNYLEDHGGILSAMH